MCVDVSDIVFYRYYHGTGKSLIETMSHYNDECSEMPTQLSIVDALRDSHSRIGLLLGACVSSAQIFCGSIATVSYSTSMFNAVSFVDAIIPYLPAFGSIMSALLTMPTVYFVELIGRRRLLLSTLALCVLADYLFMLFSLIAQNNNKDQTWSSFSYALTFLLFGIGYNMGIGPIAFFMPGELVPSSSTSAALALAVGINWLCIVITTLVYYPLQTLVGGWSYALFALPTTILLFILVRQLPETLHTIASNDAKRSLIVSEASMRNRMNDDDDYGTFR